MSNSNNELDIYIFLKSIFSFFKDYRKNFFVLMLFGLAFGITYNFVSKPVYTSSTFATSGVSFFENINYNEEELILDQQPIVDLINNLQFFIKKKEFDILSKSLNISLESASKIKLIEAEELFYIDGKNIKQKRDKFYLSVVVYDKEIFSEVQNGLIHLVNNNAYVNKFYGFFIDQNNQLLKKIDKEINQINEIRNNILELNGKIDYSQINVGSSNHITESEIINLSIRKMQIKKQVELLLPLQFYGNLSAPDKADNRIFIRIGLAVLGMFFIALFLSLVQFFNKEDN